MIYSKRQQTIIIIMDIVMEVTTQSRVHTHTYAFASVCMCDYAMPNNGLSDSGRHYQ